DWTDLMALPRTLALTVDCVAIDGEGCSCSSAARTRLTRASMRYLAASWTSARRSRRPPARAQGGDQHQGGPARGPRGLVRARPRPARSHVLGGLFDAHFAREAAGWRRRCASRMGEAVVGAGAGFRPRQDRCRCSAEIAKLGCANMK